MTVTKSFGGGPRLDGSGGGGTGRCAIRRLDAIVDGKLGPGVMASLNTMSHCDRDWSFCFRGCLLAMGLGVMTGSSIGVFSRGIAAGAGWSSGGSCLIMAIGKGKPMVGGGGVGVVSIGVPLEPIVLFGVLMTMVVELGRGGLGGGVEPLRTGVRVTFRLPLASDSILLAMAGLRFRSGGDWSSSTTRRCWREFLIGGGAGIDCFSAD